MQKVIFGIITFGVGLVIIMMAVGAENIVIGIIGAIVSYVGYRVVKN